MAAVELSRSENGNLTRIYIGSVTLWFSYETCIAYKLPGESRVVSENIWSNTTGRHINAIDGGTKEAKKARRPRAEFQAGLVELMDDIDAAMATERLR